jgi:hypothetical protein
MSGLSCRRHVRATIADEQEEEWEMRPGQSRLFPQGRDWNELNEISAWHFSSFPRCGKQIRFRLYGRGVSNQWNLLADLKTANPAPKPYPDWKPMTLPSTVTNRDLRVSLVKLVSGSRIVHYFPGEKRPFTVATFRVEQNGRLTTGWIPQWMDATDATGNEGAFQVIDMGATNGLVFYDAQAGSLSGSWTPPTPEDILTPSRFHVGVDWRPFAVVQSRLRGSVAHWIPLELGLLQPLVLLNRVSSKVPPGRLRPVGFLSSPPWCRRCREDGPPALYRIERRCRAEGASRRRSP